MTIGCDLVLGGLLLLYLAVLIAKMVISLVLGFLFPWEPPVEEDAPYEAVLRVLAPEDETYRIEWGPGGDGGKQEGEMVDPQLGYRDYPVPPEAMDKVGGGAVTYDGIYANVYAGEDEETYRTGKRDVSLGMVLFVSGQYAECSGGIQRLYLRWASHEELDSTMKRITCGNHRYASLFD